MRYINVWNRETRMPIARLEFVMINPVRLLMEGLEFEHLTYGCQRFTKYIDGRGIHNIPTFVFGIAPDKDTPADAVRMTKLFLREYFGYDHKQIEMLKYKHFYKLEDWEHEGEE